MNKLLLCGVSVVLTWNLAACSMSPQVDAQIVVNYAQKGAMVNPKMYGIFFEEINHSGDGGLYAELLQNRNFEEAVLPSGTTLQDGYAVAPHKPSYTTGRCNDWKVKWNTDSLKMVGWTVKGEADYDVVDERPLHKNTPNAMKLQLKHKGVILQNSGYWGVPVTKGDTYDLRFYLNAADYHGKVLARIVSEKGKILAESSFTIRGKNTWEEYTAEMTAADTDTKGAFQLAFEGIGTVYVDYVSLFPQKTFMNRKNGMRADVGQMLADLKPGFIRWPGGCIAEGATLDNRVKWKETIGDPMTRRSEWVLWNYHCTWGFGYHEFLQLCEDLNADGMFVANVGLSCEVRNGDYTDDLLPFIQDIEDAIEYARGDVNTKWGAKRAEAGHPEPFNLKYIELGNEQIGEFYADRYNKLYKLLKTKYPDITFISTLGLNKTLDKLEKTDMIDPHWYVNPAFFYDNDRMFDQVERGKFEIYVGEYAAISAANMDGALSEAAFISGMERNSDLVKIASYAPLLENNNRRDWPTNLIWVNNGGVMGRASYYVQQMYSQHVPTYNLTTIMDEMLPTPFNGYIGFTGKQPDNQYRNLKIIDASGQTVYESADLKALVEVESKVTSGRHSFMNGPAFSLLKEVMVGLGALEFEARVVKEPRVTNNLGFALQADSISHIPAIVFGSDEAGKNYFTLNLGNDSESSVVHLTRTVDGQGGFGRDPQGPELRLNVGEWNKVRIEFCKNDELVCSVNGKEVYRQQVEFLTKHYTLAGYDEKSGETIIKVINANEEPFTTKMVLNCAQVSDTGKVVTLAAQSLTDENSFEEPKKITPIETIFDGFDKEFTYTFAPYSFTVMRVKTSQQ